MAICRPRGRVGAGGFSSCDEMTGHAPCRGGGGVHRAILLRHGEWHPASLRCQLGEGSQHPS
jgi:hypothetical protein